MDVGLDYGFLDVADQLLRPVDGLLESHDLGAELSELGPHEEQKHERRSHEKPLETHAVEHSREAR